MSKDMLFMYGDKVNMCVALITLSLYKGMKYTAETLLYSSKMAFFTPFWELMTPKLFNIVQKKS